jgi:Mg-chelatase subunit ChlD
VNRLAIAGALLAGAGLWVAVLGATSRGPSPFVTTPTNSGGVIADRAAIKFVDKSNFTATDSTGENSGEITLRLDVLDAAGNPIADIRKEDVQVVEGDLQGRVKSFRGPASQAANVILVMDVSGSMAQQNRIAGAREAARAALDALKVGRDRLGLIAFDNRHEYRLPFGPLTADSREECEDQIARLRPRGGTLIGQPVIAALRKFEEAKPDGLKTILVMTDGEDNERNRFSRLRDQIGDLSDRLGVQVHSIVVGEEVGVDGEEDMQDLASKGKGRYERAPSAERLTELFRSRVTETVNECTLVYDSPYPTADGFDRPVSVTIRTPAGPLTANASYQVGPLLSARSKPAAWALAPATTGGAAPTLPARSTDGIRGPLFLIALIGLLAALFAPNLWRKSTPAAESPAPMVLPSGPQSIRPPPPPPNRNNVPTAVPAATAPQFVPQPTGTTTSKPSTGTVLKPPPPPPPKKG